MVRQKSIIGRILHIILIFGTVFSAILLIFTYLSTVFNPNSVWWFSFFGLGAPIIIVINILLFLYWCIKWSKIAFIPLVLLICGIGLIGRQIQLPFFKHYDKKENSIKIISYNAHIFYDMQWQFSLYNIIDFIKKEDPDIVCFQEYLTSETVTGDSIAQLLSSTLPYHHFFYINPNRNYNAAGLAIFSKHLIIRNKNIVFEEKSNGTIWSDLLIKGDTLRVFNNHLQTSSIDDKDRQFFTYDNLQELEDKNALKQQFGKLTDILRKLKTNNQKRASQADSIASIIKATPYRTIVCGDFNDVPLSYTYRRMKGDLHDTFKEKGKGYHYTFKEFFNLLKIDYIFHSDGLRTINYYSPNIPWSDHNPVIAEIVIEKTSN